MYVCMYVRIYIYIYVKRTCMMYTYIHIYIYIYIYIHTLIFVPCFHLTSFIFIHGAVSIIACNCGRRHLRTSRSSSPRSPTPAPAPLPVGFRGPVVPVSGFRVCLFSSYPAARCHLCAVSNYRSIVSCFSTDAMLSESSETGCWKELRKACSDEACPTPRYPTLPTLTCPTLPPGSYPNHPATITTTPTTPAATPPRTTTAIASSACHKSAHRSRPWTKRAGSHLDLPGFGIALARTLLLEGRIYCEGVWI